MSTPNVRKRLAAYAVAMLAGVSAVHVVIILSDQQITLASQLALVVVAIGYFAFYWANYRPLQRVRFGHLITHAIGYVIVNGSYWVHAAYLWASGQGSVIDSAWYGLLFGMGLCWGLGLAIHARATFAGQGFEDAVVA